VAAVVASLLAVQLIVRAWAGPRSSGSRGMRVGSGADLRWWPLPAAVLSPGVRVRRTAR
jgi:hypothetical protein